MELSKAISKARENKGLKQEDLARAVGYKDRSAIAQIERGKMGIPRSKVKLFSRALGIPVDTLLGEEPCNQTNGTPRLPEEVVYAVTIAGLEVEPSFGVLGKDFGDMTPEGEEPPEIYNVIDPRTAGLARFTGDELRALPPEARAVREAFESRCITGTTAKGLLYKLIDSLPEDKLPIIEAYLEGVLSK